MGIVNDFLPVQYTSVSGTGAVTIIPAAGSGFFADLCYLVVTTANAAAATLTVSDGNKTVAVLNYPNAASAPGSPLVVAPEQSIEQSGAGNAAWTVTASANAGTFNVTAQYRIR